MPVKYFQPVNYAQETVHFASATAVMAGVGWWVGPWVLAGCAAGAGLLTLAGGKFAHRLVGKFFSKRELTDHQNKGLARYIQEFTNKAALPKIPALYDFELDIDNAKDRKDDLMEVPQIKRIMNAAAGGLGEHFLLVSQPLLDALEPEEIRAVMAHEFTHLGANHTKLSLASGWLLTTTMFAGTFALGSAVLSAGWIAGALSVAGVIGLSYAGAKLMPKKEDQYTRDGEIRPKAKAVELGVMAGQEIISVAVLAVVNPVVVLTAYAVEQGSFWAANLINKSASRRREFQADRGAVDMGANPLMLIKALRKIEKSLELNAPDLADVLNWRKGPWYMRALKMAGSIVKSHPDIHRRCKRLAKMAQQHGYDTAAINAALYEPLDETGLLFTDDRPASSEHSDHGEKVSDVHAHPLDDGKGYAQTAFKNTSEAPEQPKRPSQQLSPLPTQHKDRHL
ncbi:MAG: M48 family metalloprotease [Rhodospirillales bacterium]|nr:M48 family metalloprotease [Rhodospirillales bacterium]MCB9996650.1 M48 family metalloprotease [Rhodospirillales bacterium]